MNVAQILLIFAALILSILLLSMFYAYIDLNWKEGYIHKRYGGEKR